jgi:hypothetical protein
VGWYFACAALLAGVASYHLAGHAALFVFSRDLDRAVSAPGAGQVTEVAWSFPSPNGRVMVTVPVYESEVAAAGSVDTSGVFRARGWLRERHVQRMVAANVESPVLQRLLAEFRSVRDARALDSDEYLELMVTAVQALPYGSPDGQVAFPAEVLADGSGICTDSSVLLASLLVAEGYDTVLWVFPTQWHVAVGVRSTHARFLDTEYAFIETTAPGYVGQAAPAYWARGPVSVLPQQIALGGRRSYESGEQVEAILRELRLAQARAATSVGYAEHVRTAGRRPGWYAERVIDSWAAGATVRFIQTHTHDRGRAYAVLRLVGTSE